MVSTEGALGAAATLVAIAFALSTLDRWLLRRRPHELAWTISLLMFAVASAALWLATAIGWDEASFRVFFLFGAILNVPWLALGTVYLLGGARVGRPTAIGLALVSAFAAGVLTVAPFTGPVPSDGLPQGSELFGPLPRILAAVASGLGATVLVAGALLSTARLWRGRRPTARATIPGAGPGPASVTPGRLALGNLLIALGTLVLAASGTLSARLGELESFEVTLLAGISLLFLGFLVATPSSTPSPVPRPGPVLATAGATPDRTATRPDPDRTPAPRSAEDAAQDLAGRAPR